MKLLESSRKKFDAVVGGDGVVNFHGNVNEAKHQKHKAKEAAQAVLDKAKAESRDMNAAEQAEFDNHVNIITQANAFIDGKERGVAVYGGQRSHGRRHYRPQDFEAGGQADEPSDKDLLATTAGYITSGNTEHMPSRESSLLEGSTAAPAVPAYELEAFVVVRNQLAPFEAAGATIYQDTDFSGVVRKQPFVLPGAAPSTFAEGAGPSSVQDAEVVGISLTPAKYAFLTKFSEEADADIPTLGTALALEGLTRIFQKTTAAATAALLTSLSSAGATVDASGDYLEGLLNMEAAVDPAFASTSNAFMLSRTSLSKVRNLRDNQNRPVFDVLNRTLIGYKTCINDNLGTKVVFGNWGQGAYISYSALMIQRLLEAYRESGLIGLRFARRMASAFYSDASNGAIQPLYRMDLQEFAS